MSKCAYLVRDVDTVELKEQLHSLETRICDLMDRRKSWETKEYNLKRILWMKTGELTVLSEYFNKQASVLKDRQCGVSAASRGGLPPSRRLPSR
jgi:hypothetical protein